VKKTSKQDEQDSSTDSSTRLTPRLKDDSLPNLSTNGLLNRQLTPPSPPTQLQYSYPSWRAPPHGGLPPSSYWGFRDSSFIPQGFRPVFLPIVDIPHNHLIGCVDWLLNATLFHEALDPCFYLLSIFCTTTFIGCVDRLLNATLFHEASDPCFYLLSIFCTTTFIGCVDRLLNATLSHKAIDLHVFSLSIFCTITLLAASTGLYINAASFYKAL
jgi:hypothetical protein